jgi:hypothetical protein
VKTKQGDAKVILVGGGSIVVGEHIAGVGEIIRPKFFEVANAVGAAVRCFQRQTFEQLLTSADRQNQRGSRQNCCPRREDN